MSFSKLMVVALALAGFSAAQAGPLQEAPATEVVILGVDHSAQLVNRRQQPAALRAFFAAVSPAAVCIERPPERTARNDHYEFTYEIQNVIVPWARETSTPLCAFDWLPSPEDSSLVFGIDDLERPPLLRKPSGFQGFVTFPEPRSLTQGLYFADTEEERARYRAFYATHPDASHSDFARRLFLYRTFMQARRIAAAAQQYPGKRLLVVVGTMHKDDIERILKADPAIRIMQPSDLAPEPDAAAIDRHQRLEDLAAIAIFNLLGRQTQGDNIDLPWIEEVLWMLEKQAPSAETALLRTRFDERQGKIPASEALRRYLSIAEQAGAISFTWDGVKDHSRLDSIFDPFGNLTVGQRALIEAARLHHAAGRHAQAYDLKRSLHEELESPLKQAQLDGYWSRYVATAVPQEGGS